MKVKVSTRGRSPSNFLLGQFTHLAFLKFMDLAHQKFAEWHWLLFSVFWLLMRAADDAATGVKAVFVSAPTPRPRELVFLVGVLRSFFGNRQS
jgi:hypothetical protein